MRKLTVSAIALLGAVAGPVVAPAYVGGSYNLGIGGTALQGKALYDTPEEVSRPLQLDGLHRVATGTGFFIGPDSVLTNFHVVDGCTALSVGNRSDGLGVKATYVAGDSDVDLAILSSHAPGVTPAQFRMDVDTSTQQTWAIVGYPARSRPVLQAELDRVSIDPIVFLGDYKTYSFSGSVRPGNSGSPVLDDHGLVVGVVNAKLDSEKVYETTGVQLDVVNDVGIAIPNPKVFDFLRANQVAFQPATSQSARSQTQLLSEARRFVRLIGCWK